MSVITVPEVVNYLRIDDPNDIELQLLIDAAEDYVSGFLGRTLPWATTTESQVMPSAVKVAIMMTVGDLYENREAATAGVKVEKNPAVDRLLSFYRDDYGV